MRQLYSSTRGPSAVSIQPKNKGSPCRAAPPRKARRSSGARSCQNNRFDFRRNHSVSRVAPMPPVFGPRLHRKLVCGSPRGRHLQEGPPIRQHDEGKLLAFEGSLEQAMREPPWPRACFSRRLPNERRASRARFGHQHAFFHAQAVSLHDHGHIHRIERPNRLRQPIQTCHKASAWECDVFHEFLWRRSCSLQAAHPAARPHQPHFAAFEFVTNPRDQRTSGPHHRQIGFQALC